MKKPNIPANLFSKEKLIVVGAVIVILSCVYYLFFKSKGGESAENGLKKSLAILTEKVNTTKQKQSSSVAWKKLKLNDKLYLNDEVFTQEKSFATLKFNDGSVLEMAPKTRIKLDGSFGKSNINLLSGFMLAKMSAKGAKKGASKFTIQSGKNKIDLSAMKDGEFQIQQDDAGKGQITLLKGAAKVEVDGKSVDLKANQTLEIDDKGAIQIKDLVIRLTTPSRQSQLFYQQSSSLEFAWSSSKNPSSYNLFVSKSPSFGAGTIKRSVNGTSDFVNQLTDGSYYWKVEATDPETNKTIASPTYTFQLNEDMAPELVTPTDQEKINILDEKGERKPVRLQWKAGPFAKNFLYELSKNGKVIAQSQTPKRKLLVKKIKNGNYEWRVKIDDPKRPNSPWSRQQSFTVYEEGSVNAPYDLIPAAGDQIFIGKNFKKPIRFSWKGDEKATHILEVALDDQFRQKILTMKVNGNNYEWASRVFGPYYWRVGPDKENFSTAVKINILATAPEAISPATGEKIVLYEPGPVNFSWTEVFFDEGDKLHKDSTYIVQGAATSDFESFLFQEETRVAKFSWESPEFGEVFWKTKARPHNSDGAWSSIYNFTVEKSKPPKPPLLLPVVYLDIFWL